MTYRLIIRTEAETDMTKAAAWYQNERAGLGVEFLVEIDKALAPRCPILISTNACVERPMFAAY